MQKDCLQALDFGIIKRLYIKESWYVFKMFFKISSQPMKTNAAY
jgi:hypothetical protein